MAASQTKTNVNKYAAQSDATTGRRKILHFVWDAGAAGESLLIKDTAGNELCGAHSDSGQLLMVIPMGIVVNGVTITTMSGGTVWEVKGP